MRAEKEFAAVAASLLLVGVLNVQAENVPPLPADAGTDPVLEEIPEDLDSLPSTASGHELDIPAGLLFMPDSMKGLAAQAGERPDDSVYEMPGNLTPYAF